MRGPRFTWVSEGNPRFRLLVGSKAEQVVECVVGFHGDTFVPRNEEMLPHLAAHGKMSAMASDTSGAAIGAKVSVSFR